MGVTIFEMGVTIFDDELNWVTVRHVRKLPDQPCDIGLSPTSQGWYRQRSRR